MSGEKNIAVNRRARHDYHVLERVEAGLALQGTEVKSLRNGNVNFKDAYAERRGGEMYLVGLHIAPYEQGNVYNHDPERPRKLLLHRREIEQLASQVEEKGLTIVPLRMYFTRGIAKAELGLCRGKQKADKREALQEKAQKREVERALKDAQQR
jgi:SsrA-binding protein